MIKVRVPATSANLGPGFDTLGIAIPLYLTVRAEWSENSRIIFRGEGQETIAIEPQRNLVTHALERTLEKLGHPSSSLALEIDNDIPIARGLGSSAAAIVAGVLAANMLAGGPLNRQEVLNLASALEGHPDNVVPALEGGITVSLVEGDNIYFRRIEPPAQLRMVVAIPDFELSTDRARAVRPQEYESRDVVFNLQRACFLVASLATGRLDKLDIAMGDAVHQPYRQSLIPGFGSVLEGAREAGALGVALSGAGPSVIAFTSGEPEAVGLAMLNGFAQHGIDARIMTFNPCLHGAVVDKE